MSAESYPMNNPPHVAAKQALSSKFLLFFALFANACGHTFFLISFPLTARYLGYSDQQAGMILGLSALVITLATPIWGQLCERFGRRRVLLSGLTLACLTLIALATSVISAWLALLAASSAFTLIFVLRLVTSLASGALMPAAQAYIADTTSREQRTRGMAHMAAAFGGGSIVGGTVASISGLDHLWLGYVFATVLLLLATLICWQRLPDSQPATISTPIRQPSSRHLLRYWLTTLLGLSCYSLMQQTTGLRLQDSFAFTTDQALRSGSAAISAAMLLMVITQAWLVARLPWSPENKLRAGAAACLICALLALLPSLVSFISAIVLFGLALGLLLPANLSLMSLNSRCDQQARNAGINGVFQGLGLASGPLLGSQLQPLSAHAPWLALLVITALLLLLSRSARVATSPDFSTPTKQAGN